MVVARSTFLVRFVKKLKLPPNTERRMLVFARRRLASLSLVILTLSLLASFGAEFIANDKPYILRYKGETFLPVLTEPTAAELGVPGTYLADYRKLELGPDDWAIYPPIRFNPYQSNRDVAFYPSPPSWENPFGTDDRGRDVFARLLYGLRISFVYAVGTWALTYVVGVAFGLAMGFFGGRFDFIGQRAVEVLSTVPQFFLLIILISIFAPSLPLLIAITSVFGWIPISYYARAEGLRLRKFEFVEAAKALGLPTYKVIFKHVLPNALTPILTFAPFAIATGITALAALDYLGFGLAPPTPSWGELLNQAKQHFTTAWWLALFPSMALFLTLTMLNFVGEGLRAAFDPKHG